VLLLFLVAGAVVANVSKHGGERPAGGGPSQGGARQLRAVFAVAGAYLDLPLLARVWPVAVGLTAFGPWRPTWRRAPDRGWPATRRWSSADGWMPLVSQAVVNIGGG
jgi:hypothetical protein